MTNDSRRKRRHSERKMRKLVQQREKLARLERGGSAERPIPVDTAAVVELHARDTPCHQCEGAVEIQSHTAEVVEGRSLRRIDVRCRLCHVPRSLWFLIGSTAPN